MEGARPGWRGRILWFQTEAANRAVLVAAALVVMGLALVLSLSRSGIAGFVLAILVTGGVVARRQAAGSRRRIAASYLVFLAALSLGWAGLDQIMARFSRTPADFPDRLGAWLDTLRIAGDFPVAGTGLGSYGDVMFFYQSTSPLTRFDYAHNDYVQLLAEGGLLVTVPAVVLVGLFVRETRRRFREMATTRAETRRDGDASGTGLEGAGRSTPVTAAADTRRAVARVARGVADAVPARGPGVAPDPPMYWIRVGAVTGLVAIAFQELGEFSLQMPGNAALFAVLLAVAAGTMPHRGAVTGRRPGAPVRGGTGPRDGRP